MRVNGVNLSFGNLIVKPCHNCKDHDKNGILLDGDHHDINEAGDQLDIFDKVKEKLDEHGISCTHINTGMSMHPKYEISSTPRNERIIAGALREYGIDVKHKNPSELLDEVA